MSQEKQTVLTYLKNANRPYSANDIISNLHKTHGKTAIQKALDQLVEENKVRVKVYGKQKVYSALQDQNENPVDMKIELQNIDSEINEKSNQLKLLEQTLKSVGSQFNELQSLLTTEEAEKKKTDLQEIVMKLETKLKALSENRLEISQTDIENIRLEYDKTTKEYRKRKRICTDIINSILENYPKDKRSLLEEMGVEVDDDSNAPKL